MANLRSAHENGIVVEMIKHVEVPFKEVLLQFLNQILMDISFDESWHITLLQMLPKDGHLGELANWRPIALVPVFYKICLKFVYDCISTHIFNHHSWHQHGFTHCIRIQDALLCAEVALEHHHEFNLQLWILSMDIRKALDTIDHPALIEALRSTGLHDAYMLLLCILYANQSGTVNGS